MFPQTTLHTDFARQLQADRVAGTRIERRARGSAGARIAGLLARRRPAPAERPAHAAG